MYSGIALGCLQGQCPSVVPVDWQERIGVGKETTGAGVPDRNRKPKKSDCRFFNTILHPMAKKVKIYNISGNLVSDIKINLNKHNNFYAIAHLKGKTGVVTTVVTHAKGAIAALSRRKAGDAVSFFGRYISPMAGALFSAQGIRAKKTVEVTA